MPEDNILECKVKINSIRFYKEGRGIAKVSQLDGEDCFTIKGTMEKPKTGRQYHLTAKEVFEQKWGKQYEIICLTEVIDCELESRENKKDFLLRLFTEKQVNAMYQALPEPFDSFMQGRTEDFLKVKGCGMNHAARWMEKFNQTIPLNKIYTELKDFHLSNAVMNRLLELFGSADAVIERVKSNPYSLCELEGIGWAKADALALNSGISPYAVERVSSYMLYYLNIRGNHGCSWITSGEMMDALLEKIGGELFDSTIIEAIRQIEGQIWWSEDKSKVGLKKHRKLEERIAKELFRLMQTKSNSADTDLDAAIKKKEASQGWQYTDEQKKGIETAVKNNVTVIHGLAGTGKSTVVAAILELLSGTSIQCALSGRAASRLSEITKQEGFTIHRLLGYPCFGEGEKNQFAYHDENPLPYDCVIADEISMLDGYLFYDLIRAVKTGAKLILLGDIGQLESIGSCNVAYDIIHSGAVPVVELTQIHRQAEASAIITEGRKVRNGIPIAEKDWTGTETRGKLQDLVLDCYSDNADTFFKAMEYFSKQMPAVENILDIQVIAPVKTNGSASVWSFNQAIQNLYNPSGEDKAEVTVNYNGNFGILREGDKVINRKNRYDTVSAEDGRNMPVYNGNIGIIQSIDAKKRTMAIDFQGVGSVLIEKPHFPHIHLGYAISLHSAQGSEFERIIFALDFSSYSLLTRQLLYTAFTRAKKHCTVVAQNTALFYAVSKNAIIVKQTHLKEILKNLFSENEKIL